MENIILGLLLLRSRTIYQLRKRINSGLNLMYSCSTGSIQAAIKKLIKSEYIIVNEILENGKTKKLYSITNKGKEYFNLWVNRPIESCAPKNPELTKIYFMGFSENENRIEIIKKHIDEMQKVCSVLQEICKEGENTLIQLSDNDILFFQLKTAEYGRDLMQFNMEWYKRLLKNIKGN